MTDPTHTPVLPTETLELLAPRPGETAVDCTVGGGGHSVMLAEAVGNAPGKEGAVIGFDVDATALDAARPRIEATGVPFLPVHANFARIAQRMRDVDRIADVVLADLGFNSGQMSDPGRGLSFRVDGPLDMRLDPDANAPTAADLLATLPEEELADLIFRTGEEPLGRKIARKLVQRRTVKPIQTTADLTQLVIEAYGARARTSRMHPATRTFMALRIAVNDELEALRALLGSIGRAAEGSADGSDGGSDDGGWLRADARVGIIAFHSLEDRLVKRAFADWAKRGLATLLTRRPVTATPSEVRDNPRARSAKLRVVRLGG